MNNPILQLKNVRKKFSLQKSVLKRIRCRVPKSQISSIPQTSNPLKGFLSLAPLDHVSVINGVDFSLYEGETLCLVGESGCGKSTLARLILQLLKIDEGEIHYRGERIDHLNARQFLQYRKKMQMIFQNPFSSLNQRMTIYNTLVEPLRQHFPKLSPQEENERIEAISLAVGLDFNSLNRYPHEFSGGQRQRIGIARALMVSPEFIVADEPISALDISIQSQIINLLLDLQKKQNLSYLFITHNLSVVKYIADRICIMYLGVVCEVGENQVIFKEPRHPYTQALLQAIPDFHKPIGNGGLLKGEVSTPINLKPGCVFANRCPLREKICDTTPLLKEITPGHSVACHLAE